MSSVAANVPLPDPIEDASFAPKPPPTPTSVRRWWGRPIAELRWQAELARLLVDPILYGQGVPRGDGTPVVLIPGFLAGDLTLTVMHAWLAGIGYRPSFCGTVANTACSDRGLDRLDRAVERIHGETGRKVALIGHSRGGHFVKALAHRHPDRVASAISLGAGLDTPFDISIPTKMAVAAVRAFHARTTDRVAQNGCLTEECRCRFSSDYSGRFPDEVPLTSIYTRGDGVVWWEACVVPYARCVEVTGSHIGLAFNRRSYRAIAETLAADIAAAHGGQSS